MLETCPHCGTNVLFMDDRCPSCRASRNAAAEDVRRERTQEIVAATQSAIQARPLGDTLPRLLMGSVIVSMTTLAGSFASEGGGTLLSFVGCGVGVAIVNKVVFGGADLFERLRWKRYWVGDVAGYWIAYIGLSVLMSTSDREGPPLLIYALACLAAFFVGLVNVVLHDGGDKAAYAQEVARRARVEELRRQDAAAG